MRGEARNRRPWQRVWKCMKGKGGSTTRTMSFDHGLAFQEFKTLRRFSWSAKSALVKALIGFQFNHVDGGTKTTLHWKYNPDTNSQSLPEIQFIIGSGNNLSDFTYVENVAHALISMEEALACWLVSVSGKSFFITNLEPVKFWEFISLILEGLGYQRPMIKLLATLVRNIVLLVKMDSC